MAPLLPVCSSSCRSGASPLLMRNAALATTRIAYTQQARILPRHLHQSYRQQHELDQCSSQAPPTSPTRALRSRASLVSTPDSVFLSKSKGRIDFIKNNTPSIISRRSFASSSAASSSSSSPTLLLLTLALAAATGGYLAGAFYPPALLRLAFPLPAPPRASVDSEEGKKHMQKIEEELTSLPVVKELASRKSPRDLRNEGLEGSMRQEEDRATSLGKGAAASSSVTVQEEAEKELEPHYLIVRPYSRYPPERARHSLTAGTLSGPGLLATRPLVLTKTSHGALREGGHRGDGIAFLHIGRSLCGHDGVIHGGLIATIFDEALARTAFYSLPSNVGVTARLEINYRKPTMADQIVRLETELVEAKGRKASVKGRMFNLDGLLLAEAEAIFVEPRFAKYISTSTAKEFLEG